MKCVNCKSENIKIMVNAIVSIHPKYAHRLTKKAFQSKDVELLGADWNKAKIICTDCGYSHEGC
ncbi:MAG TPA: hypothetical protein DDZ91_12150 [Firmicutes bacterium]|nr:hypothetical protein [Bacillota bacterium]